MTGRNVDAICSGGGGPTGTPSSTPPPPPSGNLTVTPSSLTFGTQTLGTTSASQAVSIKNTGTAAAPITGLATAGDFAQTNTCGSSLAVNATCTANVTFSPTAGGTRAGSLSITSSIPGSPNRVSLTGTGFDPNSNLAQGKSISDTGHTDVYVATNYSVSRVVLNLPPTWGARIETLSVLGSTDNSTYNTLSSATGWNFDPTTGDAVTIPFTATSDRYIRLTFTGNTGWPAAQLAEFQVFANGGGAPPTAPPLSYTPSAVTFGSQTVGTTSAGQAVTIKNTGTATATISGFSTTGDFAQTHTCGATLAVNATCTVTATFTPTAAGSRTGSVVVTSNAPGSPQSIALTGTGTTKTPVNLALGKTMSASSYTDVYPSSNANDDNTNSYWESANSAFPQWIQVDLGASTSVSRIMLKLPPSSSWGARTQTLSVQGSTNGTTFNTLVASTGWNFDPATGNAVMITFPATSDRYIRLNFTANTAWPAGQLSEFQVWAS